MNFAFFGMLNRFKKFEHDGKLSTAEQGQVSAIPSRHRICVEDAVGDRHALRVRMLRTAHLYNLNYFLEQGMVKPPLFVQTVFGCKGEPARIRRTCCI